MMRCDQCEFWDKDDSEEWQPRGAGFRQCFAVQERWRITEPIAKSYTTPYGNGTDTPWEIVEEAERAALRAARAYVQDGSEYRAELITGPDFFCALFLEKQKEER